MSKASKSTPYKIKEFFEGYGIKVEVLRFKNLVLNGSVILKIAESSKGQKGSWNFNIKTKGGKTPDALLCLAHKDGLASGLERAYLMTQKIIPG